MKCKKVKNEFTLEEIIDYLKKEEDNNTIEGEMLKPKLVKKLYYILGNPKEEDFKDIYDTAGRCWEKIPGYTKRLCVLYKNYMENENHEPTNWRINRASGTKMRIVEEYVRAGWHCEVQSYNVICRKYVQHPKYENIWVMFYSSRDCNKYEYIIAGEQNE